MMATPPLSSLIPSVTNHHRPQTRGYLAVTLATASVTNPPPADAGHRSRKMMETLLLTDLEIYDAMMNLDRAAAGNDQSAYDRAINALEVEKNKDKTE